MAGLLASPAGGSVAERQGCSFLKKRTKKLLPMASGEPFNAETHMLPVMSKSFLLLFFKKEVLSSWFIDCVSASRIFVGRVIAEPGLWQVIRRPGRL
jgi:hypothetical protein